MCASHETNTSQTKDMFESFNSERKELCTTNKDLRTYIDSVNKESTPYPDQNTLNFENVANITVNIDSITSQKEKMRERNICREIIRLLLTKMRKIRV